MTRSFEILSLQPFFGGSHRQFDEGWRRHSRHQWTAVTLPDRHWKWRMRHSPIEFAKQIAELKQAGQRWDAVVCTDMLDLATLKALYPDLPPVVLYFHENQFEYPNRHSKRSDLHFPFTNLTSALCADEVWFNSEFNLTSMLDGISSTLKLLPDYPPIDSVDAIREKSLVQSPGIDVSENADSARASTTAGSDPMKIVWAARWEHDKGPEWLLEVLNVLKAQPVEFSISIVGQQYSKQPEAFGQIQHLHSDQIEHWGFVSRAVYDQILIEADVFLSTANHEFFGLSFVEAVARGCCPVVPNGMAYPGLMRPVDGSEALLYETPQQAADIIESIWRRPEDSRAIARQLTTHFSETYAWPIRAGQMDHRLAELTKRLK